MQQVTPCIRDIGTQSRRLSPSGQKTSYGKHLIGAEIFLKREREFQVKRDYIATIRSLITLIKLVDHLNRTDRLKKIRR